jgi:hypothetical protein
LVEAAFSALIMGVAAHEQGFDLKWRSRVLERRVTAL